MGELRVHYRPEDGLPKQIKQREPSLSDVSDWLLAHGGRTVRWCEEHQSQCIDANPDKYSMCMAMLHENAWDVLPEPNPCSISTHLLGLRGDET